MAKHTPGPWVVVMSDLIKARNGDFVADCEATPPHLRPAPPTEEAKANARLIAAAPDMLAALESAYTSLFAAIGPAHPITCQVGAAIAKAKD
jgi:hypothetical protein